MVNAGETRRHGFVAALLGMLALGGCGDGHPADPVGWWHDLEGGQIAQTRPPPPGAHDPFPNLSAVPAKAPVVVNHDERRREAEALAAQRDRADAILAGDVLPGTPPAVFAPHGFAGKAVAPGADAGGSAVSTGTFEAAEAKPLKPRVPPGPAIRPAPDATSPADAPGALTASAEAGRASVAAALPNIPNMPPSPPNLAGMPPEPRSSILLPPAVSAGTGVLIAFAPGSDVIPASAVPALRTVVLRRATKPVHIVGHGDAPAGDLFAQEDSLRLAVGRAQAVASALSGMGVPVSALRVSGQAGGRGAEIRLLD